MLAGRSRRARKIGRPLLWHPWALLAPHIFDRRGCLRWGLGKLFRASCNMLHVWPSAMRVLWVRTIKVPIAMLWNIEAAMKCQGFSLNSADGKSWPLALDECLRNGRQSAQRYERFVSLLRWCSQAFICIPLQKTPDCVCCFSSTTHMRDRNGVLTYTFS